jgi:hypothetical protein
MESPPNDIVIHRPTTPSTEPGHHNTVQLPISVVDSHLNDSITDTDITVSSAMMDSTSTNTVNDTINEMVNDTISETVNDSTPQEHDEITFNSTNGHNVLTALEIQTAPLQSEIIRSLNDSTWTDVETPPKDKVYSCKAS